MNFHPSRLNLRGVVSSFLRILVEIRYEKLVIFLLEKLAMFLTFLTLNIIFIILTQIIVLTQDRKSTRLNSSHGYISYAVFCLKKKKTLHLHSGFKTQHDYTETQNELHVVLAYAHD